MRQKSKIYSLCVAAIALAVLGALTLFLWSMAHPDRTLLSWKDPATGTEVWLVDPDSVDLTLQLHTRHSGQHCDSYVIDKSSYGELRFARYNDRLLILNTDYVFAACDLQTGEIISYEQLPFTIYEGQGQIVASYNYGDKAVMRPGFPQSREAASK